MRNHKLIMFVLQVTLVGSGYMLTDDAPNGILCRKTDQEEHRHDPECHHASLHEM